MLGVSRFAVTLSDTDTYRADKRQDGGAVLDFADEIKTFSYVSLNRK